MRIASWNVNGLRARLEFILLWLREREPDVVGLQELKLTDEQFPHAEFEALGYRAITHGQKSWNGVAILAREEPTITARGLPGQEAMGARLISAEVADLSFTTLYCPNGKAVEHEDFPKKLAWFDDLSRFLEEKRGDRPRVVCGDFNICPTELDSWNEERYAGRIFHTDDERARFRRLLDTGLTDLYRHHQPTERSSCWRSARSSSCPRSAWR